VLQKPFVVLGDGEPDAVRQDAVRTVQWAVTLLKNAPNQLQQLLSDDMSAMLAVSGRRF